MAKKNSVQQYLSVLNTVKKNLTYIVNTYPKKLEQDLDEIARYVISRWYASRDPIYYNRSSSLYSAFKITRDRLEVEIDYDAEYLNGFDHNQGNEIIFNNAFIQGYHGGSMGADRTGESVSSPHWRTPFLYYSNWGHEAPKSFSPKELIEEYAQKRIDMYEKTVINKLKKDVLTPLKSL